MHARLALGLSFALTALQSDRLSHLLPLLSSLLQREWSGYAQAEVAEAERRKVCSSVLLLVVVACALRFESSGCCRVCLLAVESSLSCTASWCTNCKAMPAPALVRLLNCTRTHTHSSDLLLS